MSVGVLFVLGVYGTFWIFDRILEKRKNMDSAFVQEEIMAEKIRQKNNLKKRYDFIREREEELYGVFLDERDVVPTLEKMESLAKESGVSVVVTIADNGDKQQKKSGVTKKEDTKKKDAPENAVNFLLEIRGRYGDSVRFMESLERMRPIPSFVSMDMQKENDQTAEGKNEESQEMTSNEDVEGDAQRIVTKLTVSFFKFPNPEK